MICLTNAELKEMCERESGGGYLTRELTATFMHVSIRTLKRWQSRRFGPKALDNGVDTAVYNAADVFMFVYRLCAARSADRMREFYARNGRPTYTVNLADFDTPEFLSRHTFMKSRLHS